MVGVKLSLGVAEPSSLRDDVVVVQSDMDRSRQLQLLQPVVELVEAPGPSSANYSASPVSITPPSSSPVSIKGVVHVRNALGKVQTIVEGRDGKEQRIQHPGDP